jgi:hypothetical protein
MKSNGTPRQIYKLKVATLDLILSPIPRKLLVAAQKSNWSVAFGVSHGRLDLSSHWPGDTELTALPPFRLAHLMRRHRLRHTTMRSKTFLILRALLLIVGMLTLQACFEEERGPGYGYGPGHGYGAENSY